MHGETDAFRAAGRQPRYTDLILVTTLAPCRYCSGLISQFRFKKVIVGDSVNAQGGIDWLRAQGIDIVDLKSPECIRITGEFQEAPRPLERVHRRRLRPRLDPDILVPDPGGALDEGLHECGALWVVVDHDLDAL